MSMGRRKPRQETLFVATTELARSAEHPFYRKLNELLAAEFANGKTAADLAKAKGHQKTENFLLAKSREFSVNQATA